MFLKTIRVTKSGTQLRASQFLGVPLPGPLSDLDGPGDQTGQKGSQNAASQVRRHSRPRWSPDQATPPALLSDAVCSSPGLRGCRSYSCNHVTNSRSLLSDPVSRGKETESRLVSVRVTFGRWFESKRILKTLPVLKHFKYFITGSTVHNQVIV